MTDTYKIVVRWNPVQGSHWVSEPKNLVYYESQIEKGETEFSPVNKWAVKQHEDWVKNHPIATGSTTTPAPTTGSTATPAPAKPATEKFIYLKTFEEVTYDQAVSSSKIGNKIKDYINKHYPEYSNKDNNILGRYGHSLSKSSITKITKLATSKKDNKLKELLDEFKADKA